MDIYMGISPAWFVSSLSDPGLGHAHIQLTMQTCEAAGSPQIPARLQAALCHQSTFFLQPRTALAVATGSPPAGCSSLSS